MMSIKYKVLSIKYKISSEISSKYEVASIKRGKTAMAAVFALFANSFLLIPAPLSTFHFILSTRRTEFCRA